ncbi:MULTISPECIES: hypothetical protein [Dehalobacter]|uniref:HNH endonuclease n=1 Tax=Dehalobacter restrictus (strain DSM 9455 / PER-K23) TaxID=871738 RepID=A0ABN4BTV0_DEHRP|nr:MULTISPECIES: hypothetical protein [Dehalobacter]AHF10485.1 hypothetical protein DEHRE_10820 [Dehalobacter restrictus DSM 9455]MDJ0306907.1 hypothetical protein [Dehalobacter sp.]
MYQLKKCALCGTETELELSHIVPKMVMRALKKTAVGNIRNMDNPNVPAQDSEKHHMLCASCEDLFSEKETYFANTLFHPYQKKERIQFDYDSRLHYFLTSLSWRSLYLDLLDFTGNHVVGLDAFEHLISCEWNMREYLLNKRSDIGTIEHHIFFFEKIKEISGNTEVTWVRPHATFHRGIQSYTFCYEDDRTYGTITNMMGIMLITLYSKGSRENWDRTQIVNGNGRIEAKDQHITSVVGNEFTNILKTAQEASDSMSDKQKEKIIENLKAKAGQVKNYPIFQDWISDRELDKD